MRPADQNDGSGPRNTATRPRRSGVGVRRADRRQVSVRPTARHLNDGLIHNATLPHGNICVAIEERLPHRVWRLHTFRDRAAGSCHWACCALPFPSRRCKPRSVLTAAFVDSRGIARRPRRSKHDILFKARLGSCAWHCAGGLRGLGEASAADARSEAASALESRQKGAAWKVRDRLSESRRFLTHESY